VSLHRQDLYDNRYVRQHTVSPRRVNRCNGLLPVPSRTTLPEFDVEEEDDDDDDDDEVGGSNNTSNHRQKPCNVPCFVAFDQKVIS